MKVCEAVARLSYGEEFFLKGAHSGKILHNSRNNKKEHLEKFNDLEVVPDCYFAALYTPKSLLDKQYACPIIGIWVRGV